jgi:cell division protein ZapA (FtsZ GTPase activity inhibitor)
MSLKDTWKNKTDGVDDVLAEDINAIAEQTIKNEEFIKNKAETSDNKVTEITDELTNEKEYPTTEAIKKYLNEKLKQSDYNQNDPTQPDYIKNRPFYSDGKTVHKMDEKFISDAIARTADIDKKMQEAAEDVDDKIAELKIKNKASGTLLALSDSAEQPLQSMKIFGKTTQFTTTGKNKLNVRLWETEGTNFGVTVKYLPDEDCFLLNGTMTADGSVGMRGFTLPVEIGKSYTLLCEVVSGSVTGDNVGVFFLGCTDDLSAGTFENWQTVTIKNSYSKTVTPPKQYVNRAWFYCYSGATFINYKIRLMFSEGTDTTYEPYTGGIPSPNPNYPQELVSVGDSGSTTEYVTDKNLISDEVYDYNNWVAYEGHTGRYYLLNLPEGVYTVSANSTGKNNYFYVYKMINGAPMATSTHTLLYDGKVSSSYTFTVAKGDVYGFWTNISYLPNVFDIQLEAGSVATPYEPYKEQSLTISTPNGLPGLVLSAYASLFTYNPSYVADDKKVICNEIDFNRLVRREPVRTFVYTGDENWKKTNSTKTNCYYINLPVISGYGRLSHFKTIDGTQYQNGVDGAHTVYSSGLYINASQFATLEEFKTFLKSQYEAGTPLTFVYAVREEKDIIETPLTEEEIQAYKALHTNYPNTTIYNSDGAGAEVGYVADTKNYIDNKIADEVAKLTAAIITE